jgi:transposase
MFVRVKKRPNGKKSIQIVESFRRADKVSQKIVRHVGQAVTDREVTELKRLAVSIIVEMENQRQPKLPFYSTEKAIDKRLEAMETKDKVRISNLREEQRLIDGIGDVFGKLYKDLGFNTLLPGVRLNKHWNNTLKHCVLARIANPSSKLRTASLLEEDYGIKIPVEKIYRMMDKVSENETGIKQQICQTTKTLFNNKMDILFFDVTTLYFESFEPDELRISGYSKDGKFKETQVTLALVTTTDGLPISYRVFPGNFYEGHTLVEMVKEFKKLYSINNVTLVADRGMFNRTNLALMDELEITYIVAAKLKGLPKKLRDSILDTQLTPEMINNDLQWVKKFDHEGRKLIVSYSPSRAKKDAKDRLRLVERLLKKVKKGKLKVKDLISNHGTKKYVSIKSGTAAINEEAIMQDSKWDGLHGIITNSKDKTPSELLSQYRELWQIEAAFRVNKHNLKMRPIYHWTPKRIKAHITICFIAYTLVKQALHRINIQQFSMSLEQLRNELLHAQSSILVDLSNGKKYIIPSNVTVNQKKIYRVFGLKRSGVPLELK